MRRRARRQWRRSQRAGGASKDFDRSGSNDLKSSVYKHANTERRYVDVNNVFWTNAFGGRRASPRSELDSDWCGIFRFHRAHIWFPGNRNHIAIRLTLSALNDLNEALWQLAHEVVHIIGPVERGKANNLEEGVATHFALNITHYTDKSRVAIFRQMVQQASSRYRSALQDCEALLQIDSDIIKKLRKQQPYLSRITAKQIL